VRNRKRASLSHFLESLSRTAKSSKNLFEKGQKGAKFAAFSSSCSFMQSSSSRAAAAEQQQQSSSSRAAAAEQGHIVHPSRNMIGMEDCHDGKSMEQSDREYAEYRQAARAAKKHGLPVNMTSMTAFGLVGPGMPTPEGVPPNFALKQQAQLALS
jgi:hypothetical protein